MKSQIFLKLTLICLLFVSCGKEEANLPFTIDGITTENYPKVDGSTSTDPLNRLIACKLLGYKYKWEQAVFMNFMDGYASRICCRSFKIVANA